MMTLTQQIKAEIADADFKDKKGKPEPEREFVRDCFIGGGVISNPLKTYHMEFSLNKENADKLVKILKKFTVKAKKIARGGQFIVYLKEADGIADVLKIIKAVNVLLLYEAMRVEKEIRNNINRKVNCEAANLNKTVSAAMTQTEAIEYIESTVGLGYLSPPLEEVARLRLKNQDASLSEIGNLLDPPVGKSGVNHRLRKICETAEIIKGSN